MRFPECLELNIAGTFFENIILDYTGTLLDIDRHEIHMYMFEWNMSHQGNVLEGEYKYGVLL